MIPAYLTVGAWLMFRRRDAYFDNRLNKTPAIEAGSIP
jgi:hypothetical protein